MITRMVVTVAVVGLSILGSASKLSGQDRPLVPVHAADTLDQEIPSPYFDLPIHPLKQKELSGRQAWKAFLARHGQGWTVTWNEYNQTPASIAGNGMWLTNDSLTPNLVEALSLGVIDDNLGLFRVPGSHLVLERAVDTGKLWYVTYAQVHEGIRIFGSRLDLRISNGKLLMMGSEGLFPNIAIPTKPGMTSQAAIDAVLSTIAFDEAADRVGGSELEIFPARAGEKIEPRLAWKVSIMTADPRHDWVYYVDAQSGSILGYWDQVVHQTIRGNVSGRGILFDPASNPDPVLLPLPNLRVDATWPPMGEAAGFTDAEGNYEIPVGGSPVSAFANLFGSFNDAQNQAGPRLSESGTAPPPGPIDLLFNPTGAAEFNVAQVNAYFHINFVHDYLQGRLNPPAPGLDFPLVARVNTAGTCNAFYSPGTRSISFLRTGGNCINSAYDTGAYHEYGHALDDALGGIRNAALSEGISDTVSSFASSNLIGRDHSVFWEGFCRTPFSACWAWLGEDPNNDPPVATRNDVRISDNRALWPMPSFCFASPHCTGETFAGTNWHARENLIASGAGVEVAEDIVLNALQANAASIPAQIYEEFIYDAATYGTGDLTSGTEGMPHYFELCEAATIHAFLPMPPFTTGQGGAVPPWLDFGDAPSPPYPSVADEDGARHTIICGEWLGDSRDPVQSVDGEADSRQTGDDFDDGWINYGKGELRAGQANEIQILVNTSGRRAIRYNPAMSGRRLYLSAWADWDFNGSWDDPGEQIISEAIDPTTFAKGEKKAVFTFEVTPPATGTTWIRIRLDYGDNVGAPRGAARFGEVEDYRVVIVAGG